MRVTPWENDASLELLMEGLGNTMKEEVAFSRNEPRVAASTPLIGEASFIAFAGSIALVLTAVRLGLNPETEICRSRTSVSNCSAPADRRCSRLAISQAADGVPAT
jgi:hypothetical protein